MDAPDGVTLDAPVGRTDRGSLWRARRDRPHDRIIRLLDSRLSDRHFRDAAAALRQREHPRMLRLVGVGWAGGHFYLEYAVDAEWQSLEEWLRALPNWHERLLVLVQICDVLPEWRTSPVRPLGLNQRNVVMLRTGERWYPWLVPCPPIAWRTPADLFGIDSPVLAALAPEIVRGVLLDRRAPDSYALATLAAQVTGCPEAAGDHDGDRVTAQARGALLQASERHSAIPEYLHDQAEIRQLFQAIRRYRHTLPDARPVDAAELRAAVLAATDLLTLAKRLRPGEALDLLTSMPASSTAEYLQAAGLAAEIAVQTGDLGAALAHVDRALDVAPDDRGLHALCCSVLWALRQAETGIATTDDPYGDRLLVEVEAGYVEGRSAPYRWAAEIRRGRGEHAAAADALYAAAEADPQDLEALARYMECWRDDLGVVHNADQVRAVACRRVTGLLASGRLTEEEATQWNRRFGCQPER